MESDDEQQPILRDQVEKSHYSSTEINGTDDKVVSSSNKRGKTSMFVRYIQPCIAEFIGTTVFVFIGTMAQQNELLLAMAIGSGLSFAMLVYSFGQISGGHFNPAITLGVALSGGIPYVLAPAYIIVQLLGGILGAAFTRGVLSINGTLAHLSDDPETSVYYKISGGANELHSNTQYETTVGVGILNEALFTYILVTVVLLSSVDTKTKTPMCGLAMGLAVTVSMIAGGAITEGGLNPARSLAPAILISDMRPEVWAEHYVYWLGPIIGAGIAALLYRLFLAHEDRRLLFTN